MLVNHGGVRIGGVLLAGGRSSRFGGDKLERTVGGRTLADLACTHFLEAGLDPVVLVGG
ncbi:MAG: NTP transferase domain-containing protein, partial [Planctomycetota bacterium]